MWKISPSRTCHPVGHYWNCCPGALSFKSSHCNSFGDQGNVDKIYGCLISKGVAVTWLHDRVLREQPQQWVQGDMPAMNVNQCFVFQICSDRSGRIDWDSRPWFNAKLSSYQYRKSHCGDKTVVRSSYLHNGVLNTGKMSYLYWIGPSDLLYYFISDVLFFVLTGTCSIPYVALIDGITMGGVSGLGVSKTCKPGNSENLILCKNCIFLCMGEIFCVLTNISYPYI